MEDDKVCNEVSPARERPAVYVDPDLHLQIKIHAAKNKISIGEAVDLALLMFLAEQDDGK